MSESSPSGRLLIEEQPRSGEWNMAFDAALLEGALARSETILRIYRWSKPTLSLGHFQKNIPADLSVSPSPPPPLPVVRRLSGGGAILHHHEWTYSCAVPAGHPLARRGTILYEVVHAALVGALRQLGIEARLRGETSPANPFLCFLRGDARDVMVTGHKIAGSAQRRRRGAVLQHGSVLLRVSEFVPSIMGVFDLVGNTDKNVCSADDSEFFGVEGFVRLLSQELFTDPPDRAPHPDDLSTAAEIVKTGATRVQRMDDEVP